MSQLIVEVCKIDLLKPHPNADLMEIAVIKGWECCVKKNQFRVGDRVIYFPPDSVLPVALSDKLGITKYLSNGRVKVANLRGYPSMGVLMTLENDLPVGTDVAPIYGITKYEPPVKTSEGDEEREFASFHKYYSMENYKNFPNLFNNEDIVSITEKVHGQNCRVGKVQFNGNMCYCAGSHSVNRKEFLPDGKRSVYWECLDICKDLIDHLSTGERNIVVFGERFGKGIQDFDYGLSGWDFRAFDISVNGLYLSVEEKFKLFNEFGIKTVPEEYRGKFSPEIVDKLTSGPSFSPSSRYSFKEGIVITHVNEQSRSLANRFFNRTQLKNISFEYLNRKGGTEDK